MEIREVEAGETALAYEAMRALRTHLETEEEFVRRVNELQRPEGYRLLGAFELERPETPAMADAAGRSALAVAGFRIQNTLFNGYCLYVDDLSTLPSARRRGCARALLDRLEEIAREAACENLHLDSGVGPERADAHRLYLNAGMRISSHHFVKRLDEP